MFRWIAGSFVRRFIALVLVATLGCAPFNLADAAGPAPAPLRIMALGDSITAGVGTSGEHLEDGGYRGVLADLLRAHGYRAVFVGSRTDYSARIADRAHEGWPGYVLRSFPSDPGPGQLWGPVLRGAMRANAPDVVLLMAGTNDLLRYEKHEEGYTLPNIVRSMAMVIDEIVTEYPRVRVIVAPVVASPKIDACALATFAGSTADCAVSSRVETLRSVVADYADRGYLITFAPAMATAVSRDVQHFPDGIHPSGPGGYASIATAWFEAIRNVTDLRSGSVARQ